MIIHLLSAVSFSSRGSWLTTAALCWTWTRRRRFATCGNRSGSKIPPTRRRFETSSCFMACSKMCFIWYIGLLDSHASCSALSLFFSLFFLNSFCLLCLSLFCYISHFSCFFSSFSLFLFYFLVSSRPLFFLFSLKLFSFILFSHISQLSFPSFGFVFSSSLSLFSFSFSVCLLLFFSIPLSFLFHILSSLRVREGEFYVKPVVLLLRHIK